MVLDHEILSGSYGCPVFHLCVYNSLPHIISLNSACSVSLSKEVTHLEMRETIYTYIYRHSLQCNGTIIAANS